MSKKGEKMYYINDNFEYPEYFKHIKYYCRKCKFFKGKCTLNRVIRICIKKGLRNVPIQEDK